MLRFAALLVLASCALAVPLARSQGPGGRIVGGSSTNIQKYPYQVSVQLLGNHWCGGSIISANYVLTAAHCFAYLPLTYNVRVGSSLRESGGTVHSIAEFIVHPQYDATIGDDFDVALLRVSSPFSFSTSVRSVALAAQGQEVAAGTPCVATGWGDLLENGPSASVLQEVQVPIVSNAECSKSYPGGITDRMICAGFQSGGRDACQGDSGGPLVANGQQVGIVSWGVGCAREGYPGVYARVSALRGWIALNSGV